MKSRFDHRSTDEELMDDLSCSGIVIEQTLRELDFINKWLGGNHVTLSGIGRLISRQAPRNSFSIADLGCGSGDILRILSRWGTRNNVKLNMTGIDANPAIVDFAIMASDGMPDIQFEAVNIFDTGFRQRQFDIVTATLFMHHFSDEDLVELFSSLKKQAQIGIVINDIHRHWLSFHLIKMLTRFFSKSSMVVNDAPLSVLRAFRRKELESILHRAGFTNYSLEWCWAFRWRIILSTSS